MTNINLLQICNNQQNFKNYLLYPSRNRDYYFPLCGRECYFPIQYKLSLLSSIIEPQFYSGSNAPSLVLLIAGYDHMSKFWLMRLGGNVVWDFLGTLLIM